MNLRWTNAGRAALASAAHVGTAAVKLTHFALGDGQGPGEAADDGSAALRNERHRAAIAGTEPAGGRIAFRADFAPDASYSITEAGVFGTAGDPPGASQLLLYWTDDGAEAGKAASGIPLAIAAVIEFQAAAADVAVTVGGNIVFGATEPATEAAFGSTRYATAEETGDKTQGGRSVTPKGLHASAGKVLATLLGGAVGDGTVYQLRGDANGGLVVEERTQDGASSAGIAANAAAIVALGDRVTAVEGKTGDAATNRKGIAELATVAEAKAGADASRIVTPKAMRDSTAANIASLLGSAPEEGKRYVLEGLAAGGLKLVLSSVLMTTAVMTERWQSTVTYEYYDSEDESQGVYLNRVEESSKPPPPPSRSSWTPASGSIAGRRSWARARVRPAARSAARSRIGPGPDSPATAQAVICAAPRRATSTSPPARRSNSARSRSRPSVPGIPRRRRQAGKPTRAMTTTARAPGPCPCESGRSRSR